MQNDSLSGVRVLVTRPAHQAQPLCDMLAAKGGIAIKFPVMEIEPLSLSGKMLELVENLDAADIAVFISPNAVEQGIARILAHGEIPDKLKLAAIGKASAQKIQELIGRLPDIYPGGHYNSEALLALESLQEKAVNKKSIIIFRGRNGRELLAATLRQRGAKVDYVEVYQRKKPDVELAVLDTVWGSTIKDKAPDIITATSNEGLMNLISMLGDSRYKTQLMQTPLVVVTEKMHLNAQNLGFENAIIVASKASNNALLEAVEQWKSHKKAHK